MHEYWEKQNIDNPLYPEIDWEKPERKELAGKLVIIGGSEGSFRGVADAYSLAIEAGIGEVRAVIPDSLRKITRDLTGIAYAESNLSGSFSVKSKNTLLYASQWADGVLLSGEYGRNSESSIVLSSLAKSYRGILVLTKDAIELLSSELKFLSLRSDTYLVCSYSQLQKIAKELEDQKAFKYTDDLVRVVEHLHELTLNKSLSIVTKHDTFLIAASNGKVITTERKDLNELWCLSIATNLSTIIIQNKTKLHQGLASTLLVKNIN